MHTIDTYGTDTYGTEDRRLQPLCSVYCREVHKYVEYVVRGVRSTWSTWRRREVERLETVHEGVKG